MYGLKEKTLTMGGGTGIAMFDIARLTLIVARLGVARLTMA